MELGASLRVRESLGETEGLGPVNLKHEDFGKCMTVICTGSVPCAYGIRPNGFSDALNLDWILALLVLGTRLENSGTFPAGSCSKCTLHPAEPFEEGRIAAALLSWQKHCRVWFSSPDCLYELNTSDLESLRDNKHGILWKISGATFPSRSASYSACKRPKCE